MCVCVCVYFMKLFNYFMMLAIIGFKVYKHLYLCSGKQKVTVKYTFTTSASTSAATDDQIMEIINQVCDVVVNILTSKCYFVHFLKLTYIVK